MRPNLPTNSKIDGGVKVTGILAITCNAFFVFGILALEFQSGGHGEMANFYANSKRREEVPQVEWPAKILRSTRPRMTEDGSSQTTVDNRHFAR